MIFWPNWSTLDPVFGAGLLVEEGLVVQRAGLAVAQHAQPVPMGDPHQFGGPLLLGVLVLQAEALEEVRHGQVHAQSGHRPHEFFGVDAVPPLREPGGRGVHRAGRSVHPVVGIHRLPGPPGPVQRRGRRARGGFGRLQVFREPTADAGPHRRAAHNA